MTAEEFKNYKELFKELKKTVVDWEQYFEDMEVLVGNRTLKANAYMLFVDQFATFKDVPPYMAAQDSAITHSLSKVVKAMEAKVKKNEVKEKVEAKEENKFDIDADLRTEHTFLDDDDRFFSRMHTALNDAGTLKNSKEYDDLLKALKTMDEHLMMMSNFPGNYKEESYKKYLNELEEAADNYLTHKVNKGTKENSVKKVNIAFAVKEYIAQRKNTFGKEGNDIEGVKIAEEPKAQEKARAYMSLSKYALGVKTTEVTVADESKKYATRAENNLLKLGKKEDLKVKLDKFVKLSNKPMKDNGAYKFILGDLDIAINDLEDKFKAGVNDKKEYTEKLLSYFTKKVQRDEIVKCAKKTFTQKTLDGMVKNYVHENAVNRIKDTIKNSDAFAEILKNATSGEKNVRDLYDKFDAKLNKIYKETNKEANKDKAVGKEKEVVKGTVNQNPSI